MEIIYNFDFMIESEHLYVHSNEQKKECLYIKRINHSVAMLFFTDEKDNKINIPDGVVVYTFDSNNETKVILEPIGNAYPLCWTDNYVVEINEKVLINIQNQRKWVIS